MDFTANWDWPQWVFMLWVVSRLGGMSLKNGDERLYMSGPRQGQPERYSFLMALIQCALAAFILICGGFFA